MLQDYALDPAEDTIKSKARAMLVSALARAYEIMEQISNTHNALPWSYKNLPQPLFAIKNEIRPYRNIIAHNFETGIHDAINFAPIHDFLQNRLSLFQKEFDKFSRIALEIINKR